ncbi:MAG TPA: hypothetical protein VLD18_15175 [Verrucomicrobiae bacterium]|nr:hypothetical protein [Verrucomicrobiae bacterium]
MQTANNGSLPAEYAHYANSRLVSTVGHRYGLKNRMVAIRQSKFGTHPGRSANGPDGTHFCNQLVKITFHALGSLALLLVLCGCGSRKKGVDWTSEAIVFSNRVATVYWEASEWVDGSRLSNRLKGRVTKHRTARHFLISRLNLDTRECVEEFVPKSVYERALFLRKECISKSVPADLSEDVRVLDANCLGGFVLMGPLFSNNLVIVRGGKTNSIPALDPYTLIGWAGINEHGECFFVKLGAGIHRRSEAQVPFAVFRDGKWWTGHIPGKMPELGNKDWARTSTVPALVEMPIGQ